MEYFKKKGYTHELTKEAKDENGKPLYLIRNSEDYPKAEIENIWFTIYGKLNRGETESELEEYCKTVSLSKKNIHKPNRLGY